MARRATPPEPQPPKLTIPEMKRGIERLEQRVNEVETFDPDASSEADRTTLEKSIEGTLQRIFGTGTADYLRYSAAAQFDNGPWMMFGDSEPRTQYIRDGRAQAIALLKAAIKDLTERVEDAAERDQQDGGSKSVQADNRKVFIVHGHDAEVQQSVARVVERLGLEAIILGEQPAGGATIVEKFEEHSEVRFAIVLLTPDDFGGKDPDHLKPRARQNVILELGYFMGKLTRKNVCVIIRGDELELPSDIHGVCRINYEDGGDWRYKLGSELRKAGIDADLNKLG